MARSATLDVRVLLDAAQAASGLNDVAGKFESFGKKLTNAVVGAVAIKGISEIAKSVVSSASTMQQAIGGTDKVFGSSADVIHEWASDTTDSIRLPAASVEKFATLIKTQLNATGQPIGVMVENTKKLVQVGADLAAVTGADLADSIAAVKGALAGEYDPIQNLGVAMTGTTVNLRALEIAHGDTAKAATESVIAQARVAEIMDKSAFATGAAAEESQSFQARMDGLKEQASTLAVAIGGPLLDSLSNIVGGVSDAASGATTLGTGLGTILGSVLALPAPIQAAVLGLAAFAAISATWGTKVAGAFTTMMTSVRSATSSVGALRGALSSLGPALAGGAAIAGVAILIGLFAQAIGRVTEGAKSGEEALSAYRSAIVEAGGASTDATAAAFKQALLTSEAYAELTKGGYSASDAVKILTGTQEDWIAVQGDGSDASRGLTKDALAMTNGFIDANGHAKTLAQAQIDGAAAMDAQAAAAAAAGPVVEKAEKSAAESAKELADALKTAQEAAQKTTGARFLAGIKDAADEAGRALDLFSAQIDAFTARGEESDSLVFDYADGLRDLGDAFKSAAEDGGINVDALTAWNDELIASSGPTTDFARKLSDQADNYDELVSSAYSAAAATGDVASANAAAGAAADSARGKFVDYVAGLLGGGDEAIGKAQAIADQLGILGSTQIPPAIFEIIADDAAAQAAVASLKAAGNDPVTFSLEAGADGALHTVDDVISYVDAAGSKATVAVTANPAAANATVDGVQADINSTTGTLKVAADPAGANSTVGTTASGVANRRDAILTVGSNTTAFQSSVTALIRDVSIREAKLSVTADTGPAARSIASITGAYYSATVHVIADTAGFFATFNSLPKSSGVGAAPRVSFAAPVLQTRAGSAGAPVAARSTQSASLTINISGALDPDGVARQVDSILERRVRRTGGIVV